MRKIVVSCGFTEAELSRIDQLVEKRMYCSRSDAVRCLTRVGLQKGEFI